VKARILAVLLAIAAIIAVIVGVGKGIATSHAPAAPPVRTFPHKYVGIITYNLPQFNRECGCAPNIAVHYIHLGSNGRAAIAMARSILAAGAVPMLELEPYDMSMADISAGAEDSWLAGFARAVRSLKAPVIMSFAPEANGNWYSWAYPHVAPLAFVSAWRHVVTVFRRAGADRVRWAWIMNVNFAGSENLHLLWPGRAFVDILGIDGYFLQPSSFAAIFGPTIVSMRSISSAPLLITETAAAPVADKLQALRDLISGVREYGVAGFVWFDVHQQGSITRQDWRLEDVPAALALFGEAVQHIR